MHSSSGHRIGASLQSGASTSTSTRPNRRDSNVNNLRSRLRTYMNAIVENFERILARAKIETVDTSTAILNSFAVTEQDTYELSVRAANMVHAGESITRLIAEIKQILILADFSWLNESGQVKSADFRHRQHDLEQVGLRLAEKLALDLYHVEEECGVSRLQPSSATVEPQEQKMDTSCCTESIN